MPRDGESLKAPRPQDQGLTVESEAMGQVSMAAAWGGDQGVVTMGSRPHHRRATRAGRGSGITGEQPRERGAGWNPVDAP